MEKTTQGGQGWQELSKYVVLTLTKLADSVDKNEQDIMAFREKLIVDLQAARDGVRSELCKCQDKHDHGLEKALEGVDGLIEKLSDRTYSLEKIDHKAVVDGSISELKEQWIFPLSVRVAIISVIAGALGGTLLPFVWKMIFQATVQ